MFIRIMKNLKLFHLFLLAIFSLCITNCEERKWNNPFESGQNPGAEIPINEPIVIRARGNIGSEWIELLIDDVTVQTSRVSTVYQDYIYYASDSLANIKVYFSDTNGGDYDVQIDYIKANDVTYQAEKQAINTGVYQNDNCGGSYSEWIHCEGYIDFGTIVLGN